MTPAEAAIACAERGIPVVLLHGIRDGVCTCTRGAACESPGKHPRHTGWQRDATTNPDLVRGLFGGQIANVGGRLVAIGQAVLDADTPEAVARLRTLVAPGAALDNAPIASTVRGVHVYVSTDAKPGLVAPGLELKNELVVMPGSVNPDGSVREWLREPNGDRPPELPAELRPKPRAREAGSAGGPIPENSRNNTLTSLAGSMRYRGMTETEILAALLVVNRDRCEPPLDEDEVHGIASSIGQYAPADDPPPTEPTGDDTEPETEPAADDQGASWAPRPLDPSAIEPPSPPTILEAADGLGALFYPDKRHLVFGETESHKTWICLAAAADVVRAGSDVIWIDSDGMGRAALAERLGALGLSEDELREHALYVDPERAIDQAGTDALLAAIRTRDVGLCVIDAHDPALEINDLDPNLTADILRFVRLVVDLFHRRDVPVLVTDHVARGGDGKDPIGAKRKVDGYDVAVRIKLKGEPMTRQRPYGTVSLYGRKDRPGWHNRIGHERYIGEIAFDLRIKTRPWALTLGRHLADAPVQEPTVLMERVSRWMEARTDPASMSAIEQGVSGKTPGKRWAVERLLARGNLEALPGRRKGDVLYTLVTPYRDESAPNPSPNPPQPAPNHRGVYKDPRWGEFVQ